MWFRSFFYEYGIIVPINVNESDNNFSIEGTPGESDKSMQWGCKKSCVYEKWIFLIRFRYVIFCRRIYSFVVVEINFLFTVLPFEKILYIFLYFFAWQTRHCNYCFFRGRCPHPTSGIESGSFGNNTNADRIERKREWLALKQLHSCFSFLTDNW